MTPKTRLALLMAGVVVLSVVVGVLVLRRPSGPLKPADPLELLPDRCQAVVVVPDLGRLGEHLAVLPKLKLATLLSSMAGYPDAEGFFADLARQAGYDPRSRASMAAVGLDPSRPLIGYISEEGVALLAIPESDSTKIDALLENNAVRRLGAKKRTEERAGSQSLTLFSTEGTAAAPAIAWSHGGGYVFLTQGAPGVQLLKAVLERKTEGSLSKDTRFAAARQRLGGQDLYAFSCVDALPLKKRIFIPYGTIVAASLSANGAKLSLELPLDDAWAGKLQSLATPAGTDLLGRVDPNAFLIGRLGGDPRLLEPLLDKLLPSAFKRAFHEGGIDPKAELLQNLQPGVALSLSLAPSARLSGVPELDVRRTNPFEFVTLSLVGRPLDPSKASQTLKKVAEIAPRFGARMEQSEISGTPVFTTRYHLGEGASLALKDDFAVVTGGVGQMQAQLERLSQPAVSSIADPEARRSLQEDAFALYLDATRLIGGVRQLPDSAYGIGGFAIRAAVSRWLDAVEEITALRASARLGADKTLHAELALTLKLAPPMAQKDARAP